MKLPVASLSITLNEIPNHFAVAIELGNCKQKCAGCHSPWLSIPLRKQSWTELETIMRHVNEQVKKGANAIVIMGGTHNGVPTDDLISAINILSCYAPVGLYSGLTDEAPIHQHLKNSSKLKWLKTGGFVLKLGGLTSPRTNQRFYERQDDNTWEDKTKLFQR